MRRVEPEKLFWDHFDARRTRETGGDADFLRYCTTNLTAPVGSSHREDVQQMAGASSLPIVLISPLLDEIKSIRGRTYFGNLGRQINKILDNYPGMLWWIAKDGLVIDVVPHDAEGLSEFDRRAGKLACDGAQGGRLSADAVLKITAELDSAKFKLSVNLQPAQWKPIAEYNKKYGKKAMKTFTAAVSNPKFAHSVRRRLYVARERYRKAYNSTLS